MLRPTATSVFPEDNYILRIVFDNGETKRFDVKPYIQGEWYGKLADRQYFCAVKTDGFTVVWPEGQDLCPDELYDLSISVNWRQLGRLQSEKQTQTANIKYRKGLDSHAE